MGRGALSVMTTGASLTLVLFAECLDLVTPLLLISGKIFLNVCVHVGGAML